MERSHQQSFSRPFETAALSAAIVDALPAHLAILDPEGWIMETNANWREFGRSNGLAAPYALGSNYLTVCEQCVGAEKKEAMEALSGIRAVLSGLSPAFQMEYACHVPSGRERWFRLMASGFATPEKKIGALVLHVDITFRKMAEEQLRKSMEMYRVMFQSNPIPTWVFAEDTLQFLAVNAAAVQQYGYSEAEFLALTIRDIRPGDQVPLLEGHLRSFAGQHHHGIWSHRKKNGEMFDAQISASPIEYGGRKARLVLAQDVSLRRKFEERMLQTQRLESIGTLAGGMAHDLNNILSPIALAVDLLRQSTGESEGQDCLDLIDDCSRRSKALLQHILTFARGGEGDRRELQLSYLLREMERMLRNTLPRNIQLRVEMEPDLWPVVADGTQIHQVLLNLCLNARDAMPDGGSVVIKARNAFLDEHYIVQNQGGDVGHCIQLEVSDTGTGIATALLERIFDPFFTTKEPGEGTGLGLWTASAIVKNHGGFIRVYSEIGRGSTFHVFLPALPIALAEPQEQKDANLPQGSGQTVLVVDDEEALCEITARTLEAHGYAVLRAEDGATAVNLYSAQMDRIAVVILDMMMPVLDGAATAMVLRQLNPAVQIIAVSGFEDHFRSRLEPGPGISFLTKPFHARPLLEAIEQMLRRPEP